MIYLVFTLFVGGVYSDYDCLCNYNVEKSVYLSASNQGQPVGYLYEFDCKQILGDWSSSPTWATVAFEHKIGYVEKDAQVSSQVCPGDPPSIDIVTTKSPTTTSTTTMPSTTSSVTIKPTTTSTTMKPTTTSTTMKPTTTSTTMKPTTTTTTMKLTTTPSTMKTTTTPTTIKPTTTSTTTEPTTTSTTRGSSTTFTTIKPTTISPSTKLITITESLTQITTSKGTLVCPLNVQQVALAEKSTVFVNDNNGKCYEMVSFKRTWSFAEEDCKTKGGHLTSIENINEDKLLYGHVQSYGSNTWIGLNDKNSEEHFEWTTGETFAYRNWHSGRMDPNSHSTQDCVSIDFNTGQWEDEGCGTYHAYICKFDAVADNGTHVSKYQTQIPTTSTTVPTTSVTSGNEQLSCPQKIIQAANNDGGSAFVSGDTRKCYEFVTIPRTWGDAENDCQKKGGHLATVGSQSVETLLYGYVKSYGHTTWIGLNDQNREEHFKWSSGDHVTYLNWHAGRKDPDYHRFEDCVAMGALTGTWEDMDCDYKHFAYICEFDAVTGNQGPYTSVDGNTQLCSSSVRNLAVRDNAILGQFERGCYELIRSNAVSWQHGEDMCQSRGGHLAHISNAQQQSFIQSFLNRYSPQHAVWIGLHDTKIEGAFQWTAGTSVSYTNWIPGHLSNFESFRTEDCVAFIPYKNGKWDDVPCGDEYYLGDFGETHPILCQYKIPLSPGIVGR